MAVLKNGFFSRKISYSQNVFLEPPYFKETSLLKKNMLANMNSGILRIIVLNVKFVLYLLAWSVHSLQSLRPS